MILDAAGVVAKLQYGAEIFVGDVDGRRYPRLLDALDPVGIGHVGRVVELDHAPAGAILRSGEVDVVDDARRGGDEIETIFAGQALLDDLEVAEAAEAAADRKSVVEGKRV